jgi:hypothetical protein
MTKVWTKEEIRGQLETKDHWVIRGLLALYEKQTIEEQDLDATTESNGVGFSAFDAEILSSFAKQILQSDGRYNTPLSPKQLVVARKRILKYSGQLACIANAK